MDDIETLIKEVDAQPFCEHNVDKRPHQVYKDCWDEDKWQDQMVEHPFFVEKSPLEEGKELSPLIEAMSQLKYDEEINSKQDLALNYKEDGNQNFKLKKYRWAIDAYTHGINQQCEDNLLNSILYNNRASAHYNLQNYRSALRDALTALKFNRDNDKAKLRVAQCYFKLLRFEDCIKFCKSLDSKCDKIKELEDESQKEIEKKRRDERKLKAKEKKEEEERARIVKAVQSRRIKFRGSLFDSFHPASKSYHVYLNQFNQLVWPVLFIYPEYGQTDFIEEFLEDDRFIDHIRVMFGSKDNRPHWDVENKYLPNNVRLAYKSGDELKSIDTKSTLRDVLTRVDYEIMSSLPTFIVTSGKICHKLNNCMITNLV